MERLCMENVLEIASLIAGMLLRIGIPVAITAALVYIFSRLDARWRAEAEQSLEPGETAPGLTPNCGCWKIMGCTEESRAGCKAFASPDAPCWHVYRSREGLLQEKCLACRVFREAPVPA